MKKYCMAVLVGCTVILASCGFGGTTGTAGSGGSILGQVLGNAGTIGNVLTSVLGLDNVTQAQLIGTWRYTGPGCAFTSEKALAEAGGEVVAAQIKEKMLPYYQKLNLTAENTFMTINEDGTYAAKIGGRSLSGKYTFDEKKNQLQLKSLLLNMTCYTKRTSGGVSFLFESKKLLTVLQTIAALSGDQTIQTVGEISKNYDGVRLGFDMKK